MVKAALYGKKVKLDEKIPGEDITFRAAISDGYYLNSVSGNPAASEEIIPLLSPFLLITYAHTASDPIANCLRNMLELEQHFYWECFEHFHGHYEILRRLLYEGQMLSLAEFYNFPKLNNAAPLKFKLAPKQFFNLKQHFPQFPPHRLEDDVTLSAADLQKSVVKPARDNPGFDLAIIEVANPTTMAVAIECRFSEPGADTKLTQTEVQKKHQLTRTAFASVLKRSIIGKALDRHSVVLVVVAYRELAGMQVNELENTIVLGRAELQALYSPTLTTRPQFYMDTDKE